MDKSKDVVQLFFENRKETLEIVNTGGNLFNYLTKQTSLCPLIKSKITLVKMLGKGASGQIFSIDFNGKGSRRYAVKITEITLYTENKEPMDVMFKKLCSNKRKYHRTDGRGVIEIPKGSFICESVYSEYIISLLIGEIIRNGTCINFLDTFAFALCPGVSPSKYYVTAKQYTFMEQIDTTLRRSLRCIVEKPRNMSKSGIPKKTSKEISEFIFIQILFGIAVYQKLYNIVHGDLHDDNVFLVHDPNLEWKGHKIGTFDNFKYTITNPDGSKTEIYLPAIPLIVKIADFGLAVKYSKNGEPIIGEKTTMENGFDHSSILPNFYNKAYDVVYIADIMQNLNPSNEFIKGILTWMANGDMKNMDRIIDRKNFRPKLELLETELSHVSPEAILSNPKLMGKYLERPPKGNKILNIGNI